MITLGTLRTGEMVLDRHSSHLHPSPKSFLPEALSCIDGHGRTFIVEEVEFDEPIGNKTCVPTYMYDIVMYAKRTGREGHTRFVLNRLPLECSHCVVVLKKAEKGDFYVLITAYIGRKSEPEPWDKKASKLSREFWSRNALIWGTEETVPGTETFECPW